MVCGVGMVKGGCSECGGRDVLSLLKLVCSHPPSTGSVREHPCTQSLTSALPAVFLGLCVRACMYVYVYVNAPRGALRGASWARSEGETGG